MTERRTILHAAPTGSLLPVLVLAAAGIVVILLAGSLGAATSGRGVWSPWSGPSEKNGGQAPRALTRTSDLPEILDRSGV